MFAKKKRNKRRTAPNFSDRYLTAKEKKAVAWYEFKRKELEEKKSSFGSLNHLP